MQCCVSFELFVLFCTLFIRFHKLCCFEQACCKESKCCCAVIANELPFCVPPQGRDQPQQLHSDGERTHRGRHGIHGKLCSGQIRWLLTRLLFDQLLCVQAQTHTHTKHTHMHTLARTHPRTHTFARTVVWRSTVRAVVLNPSAPKGGGPAPVSCVCWSACAHYAMEETQPRH